MSEKTTRTTRTTTPTAVAPRPDWLPEEVWPTPLRTLRVDGRTMVYSDTGGDGPVLLMVHVGLWSMVWGGLIEELRGDFRCVTLDVPGAGLSERTPPAEQTLSRASAAIGALVDALDLREVTLAFHDTGGLAALAAVASRTERIAGLVGVATFAWPPRGRVRWALRVMGSAVVREVTALTGFLAWGSAGRFGVGRSMTRAQRRACRRGMRDRSARRFTHRMFRGAVTEPEVGAAAAVAVERLADRPVLTVFGRLGDYFGFQRRWRRLRPDATTCVVPWGMHFPMCDDPALVGDAIRTWHAAPLPDR
ncbi:alpha/beta hydrolase [Nocardioides sp. YIM 152588]|uniref:alpha/beta fold hydrolase n=1 Tax=Nocardioides sp. YIM 152588 TaxID=3158259 RepID=UPI0032E4525D